MHRGASSCVSCCSNPPAPALNPEPVSARTAERSQGPALTRAHAKTRRQHDETSKGSMEQGLASSIQGSGFRSRGSGFRVQVRQRPGQQAARMSTRRPRRMRRSWTASLLAVRTHPRPCRRSTPAPHRNRQPCSVTVRPCSKKGCVPVVYGVQKMSMYTRSNAKVCDFSTN